jgi:ABC-2 type transport system permease protein
MSELKHPWWTVARFEFLRVIRRTDFVVSLVLMPLLSVGASVGAGMLAKRAADAPAKLAFVSEVPGVTPKLAVLDTVKAVTWFPVSGASADEATLKDGIEARRYDGAVIIPAGFAAGDSVRILARRSRPGWARRLREPLQGAAQVERSRLAGVTPEVLDRLNAPVALKESLTRPESGTSKGDAIAALALTVLLLATIYATAAFLGVGITGEKQARVTEVIVSAIKPQAWMDGKLVGFTLVGLLMATVWGGSALLFAVFSSWTLPPAVSPGSMAAYVLFIIAGFAFYVSMFSAILATIKDMQSTSRIQAYFYFIPVIPFIFIETILERPESMFASVLSWIPFFAPMLMPARIALKAAPMWEWMGALVVLIVATWFMRLAAGTAFRVGMLMYGKEVNLPELVRWAKEH